MAADASVLQARKPQLKGLHGAVIAKNLKIAIAASIVAAVVFKFTYAEPKKAKYANFYKDYNPQAAFEKMKAAGVFVSAPAE